ncbi:MAG: NADH-quinone oxidoreductase subunit NuoI [Nitrospinae bacterium]|nr:NADH-quinone oxidoreductase subunit NuoI [Nitrospinota bacterium]
MFASIFRGLWLTLKHSWKSRETVQYPEQKESMPIGYRGLHKLLRWEDGLERCVGCKLCSAACPVDCIYVESEENESNSPVSKGERYASIYEINELRCIFCGYCEEACPVGAIVLSNEYEFCADDRNKFLYQKEDFLVDRNEDYPELKNRYLEEKLLTYL